jgi:hypothetical protein
LEVSGLFFDVSLKFGHSFFLVSTCFLKLFILLLKLFNNIFLVSNKSFEFSFFSVKDFLKVSDFNEGLIFIIDLITNFLEVIHEEDFLRLVSFFPFSRLIGFVLEFSFDLL